MSEADRFTSHMAGAADPLMQAIAARLDSEWVGGAWDHRLAALCEGSIAAAWVCGLLYADLTRLGRLHVVPVAAPVMAGDRYADRPVYFGDLIVRSESRIRSIGDLAGATMAVNEVSSLSGHRMLLDRFGSTGGMAGAVVSGSHAASVRTVLEGGADAASIDSTLLDMLKARHPSSLEGLRIVGSLGPYPAPPIVARPDAAAAVAARLFTMHEEPSGRSVLAAWGIRRFAGVTEADYTSLADP